MLQVYTFSNPLLSHSDSRFPTSSFLCFYSMFHSQSFFFVNQCYSFTFMYCTFVHIMLLSKHDSFANVVLLIQIYVISLISTGLSSKFLSGLPLFNVFCLFSRTFLAS